MIKRIINKIRTKMGKGFSVILPVNATEKEIDTFNDCVKKIQVQLSMPNINYENVVNCLKELPNGTLIEMGGKKYIIDK